MARDFYSGLARENENIEVRQILTWCPHSQLTRTDRYAMLVPYLYSERTGAADQSAGARTSKWAMLRGSWPGGRERRK